MKVWIASSSGIQESKYLELSREVAKFFAEGNYELLCGGINDSMMRTAFEEFQKRGLITTVVTLPCYHEDLSEVTEHFLVSSTMERSKQLYELADVLVFLPGGTGTLSEIFSSLEEYRTENHEKPFIIYNYEGFYNPMMDMIEKLIQEDFNDESIIKKMILVQNINELKKKVSEENE